jgi:hypothetical protein
MCVDVAAYHGFCLLAFGVCIRNMDAHTEYFTTLTCDFS